MVGAATLAFDGLDEGPTVTSGRVTSGRLIVCPTPIGNLEDVTLRVLAALREADIVACEDTRRTRILLDRYGVGGRLVSYHEHNERARAVELVKRMQRRRCRRARVRCRDAARLGPRVRARPRAAWPPGSAVEVLPGPSAALSALVASALPADHWRFVGFLPRKRAELEAVFGSHETVVAFESPRRLAASLDDARGAGPEAPGRRLPRADQGPRGGRPRDRRRAGASATAPSRRGARSCWSSGPQRWRQSGLDQPLAALQRLVDAGAKPRVAAGVVAELTGVSANALYRLLTTRS